MYGVLSTHIDSIWPDVASLLERAIIYSDGKYQIDDVYQFLKDRAMQLWVAFNNEGLLKACCISQIVSYPRKKVLILIFVAGIDSTEWIHFADVLKEFAMDKQCQSIEFYGRPGWEKLTKQLGFKKIHTVFKFDL